MPGDIWLTFPDGKEHELNESVTIGRDDSNDLTFTSATVSRDHAALRVTDGRWYVEDRGSFNGTFLNGTRVQPGTPLPLRHADRIGIGAETSALLLAGSAAGPGYDRAARRGRARGFRAAVLVPAPGRAVPLRSVARGRQSRDLAVERADRRTTRDARRNREPSKQHYAASMQRPGSRISLHTRSVAHSVASHASAVGSSKTAREHTAPSRPLRSSCEG